MLREAHDGRRLDAARFRERLDTLQAKLVPMRFHMARNHLQAIAEAVVFLRQVLQELLDGGGRFLG